VKHSLKNISLKELAGMVSGQLAKHKIEAVLTGGACVTIFSENKYRSLDLDFVTHSAEYQGKVIKEAMAELGFAIAPEGFFKRSDCQYIIEFLPPPLAVGSEPVKQIITLKTRSGNLRLLSPTDCVKDRLAAYYHWRDSQSLEQAVMVARKRKVDLKEVERWSAVEGHTDKYAEFLRKLKGKG
jgi:hypothetical protein